MSLYAHDGDRIVRPLCWGALWRSGVASLRSPVVRVTLSVVMIAAVITSPVVRQEEARAQAQGIGAAAIAACGASFICLVAAAAGTAAITWYVFSGGDADDIPFLDGLFTETFEGTVAQDTTWSQQVFEQYRAHPTYINMTQQMVDAWQSFVDAIAASQQGWQLGTTQGINFLWDSEPVTTPQGVTYASANRPAINWPIVPPSETTPCQWRLIQFSVLRLGPEYTQNNVSRTSWGIQATVDSVLYQATGTTVPWSSSGTSPVPGRESSGGWLQLGPQFSCNAGVPQVPQVTLVTPATSQPATAGGWDAVRMVENRGTQNYYEVYEIHETFIGTGAIPLTAVNNERVNIPATPDEVIGWDGTAELPLASGNTGAVVEENTGTGVGENSSWWEGLFGGVTDWLADIWDAIRSGIDLIGDIIGYIDEVEGFIDGLEGLVTDVVAAVEAIPGQIAALFDPAIAVENLQTTQWPQLQATAALHAPWCYIGGFQEMGSVFVGGTDGTINIPYPTGQGVQQLAWTPPSSVTSVTHGASTVFALVVLFGWAFWQINRVWEGRSAASSL